MSIQAMAWAIEQQEVTEPFARFVLLALANYAAADGSAAFPSVLRLALDTGLSERTVQRYLRSLEKLALIRRGSRAFAAVKISRADRLPQVYDLLMPRGVTQTPRESTGCHPRQNGVTGKASRGVTQTPDPKRSVIEPKSAEKLFDEEFQKRFGQSPSGLAKKVRQ